MHNIQLPYTSHHYNSPYKRMYIHRAATKTYLDSIIHVAVRVDVSACGFFCFCVVSLYTFFFKFNIVYHNELINILFLRECI